MNSPAISAALDSLVAAIRSELKREFLRALGGGEVASGAPRSRGKAPGVHARRKGAKRTPEELASLTSSVLAFIKQHPASRVEQIAAGLGTTTKDLALPINKLWNDKALKVEGQRRGMKYTAK